MKPNLYVIVKTTLNKDSQGEIVNYDTEDDKKVLCLMVDSDKINYDDEINTHLSEHCSKQVDSMNTNY